jgi:sporulation protein YlmC with PRC-barrel domain
MTNPRTAGTPLLQNVKELYGLKLAAVDGEVGHVKDFYFDDQAWVVRYVVVDTGSWLTGRLVLLSPHAFPNLDQRAGALPVNLRKAQIQDSPSIGTHETVTRQFEEQYYRSYGWPVYWEGGQMWGLSGYPLAAIPQSPIPAVRKAHEPRADRHLQSTKEVAGHHLEATDGTVGRVTNFHLNPRSWAIEELVVETGHWRAGEQILVPAGKIERIDFMEKKVLVQLTRAELQRL